MKKNNWFLFFIMLGFFGLLPFVPAMAQDGGAVASDALSLFLKGLIDKFPVISGVIAVVGILRLVVKPIVSALRAIAEATPSPKDNELLDKAEASPIYKGFLFVLDWFASIKPIK